ncbi:MAG: hypothetical protein J6O73_02460 [Lachnospiraceae bacterium]|nr:hypothetical protein [Lachnospiraceae bacterium]
MKESSLKELLGKYKEKMDKVYYVALAYNLLSHVLAVTPVILFIELLVRKLANGTMTEGQIRLLIDSMINLRLFIVIPAVFTVLVEMDKQRDQLISISFIALGWFYSFHMREWNDNYIFNLALLIVASYKKDFHKILRYSIWIVSIVTGLCVVVTALNILPSHYDLIRNGRVRHAFGMTGPTGFAGHVCFVLLMIAFVKDGCLKWYDYLCVVILSILNILLVDGRVALLCAGLLLAGSLVKYIMQVKGWEISERISKPVKYVFLSSYALIGGMFMLLAGLYKPEFLERFSGNRILESFAGRLEPPHRLMQELSFSFLGNYYTKYFQAEHSFVQNGEYNFIDSSYARMYLIYGLVGFVLTMLICTLMQWRLMKENMIYRMYILSICAVFYLVQRGIFDPDYHVFPLIITANLLGRGDWSESKGKMTDKSGKKAL